jgi:DNA polymerase-3 subunit gamma/tau
MGKLELICQKEDVHAGTESLRLIARAATGSLRDAENILQQLLTYYGNQIDFSQVQTALGLTGDSRVRLLARHIVNKDIPAGLQVINSISGDGIDLRQFNLELVEYLRGLLLAKSDCEGALDVTPEDLAEMRSLVATTTLDYLLVVVKLFSSIEFRSDNYSALPLELALIDCVLSSTIEQEQPTVAELPEAAEVTDSSQEAPESSQEAEIPEVVHSAEALGGEASRDFDYFSGRWREFIQSLRGEGSSGNLDAFLRSACEPLALEDDTLILGFYYSFHKEKIEDPKYRHLVERKLKEVFGRPYKIKCILVDHKRKMAQSKEQSPLIKAALEMGAEIKE